MQKLVNALGLMSGTSLDGIDLAWLSTDGENLVEAGPSLTVAYEPGFRAALAGALGQRQPPADLTRALTLRHAQAVRQFRAKHDVKIDVLGFHGQTLFHRPDEGVTVQMGDGALLADETGIDVVGDFRSADVAAGGQGAPLVPLYHAALAHGQERPLAVLNIGGVANVTWLGREAGEILAFDTGPGNALLDDLALKLTGEPMDRDAKLARSGKPHRAALAALMKHPYFERRPPKSLDRDDFARHADRLTAPLAPADGAATLAAFTAQAVAEARKHFPEPPLWWLVCGGGAHNPLIMARLRELLEVPVDPVEVLGWDGDVLEAQAFAYLAVRVLRGLPLTLPTTTGVRAPTKGGRVFKA